MVSKIKQAIEEYENKNYENALNILEDIEDENVNVKNVEMLKTFCLMNLRRYSDALVIINKMIEKDPYNFSMWVFKVNCHYFNDEKDIANKSLKELERIADRNDKKQLVEVAHISNLIRDSKKAIEYSDLALSIDECYIDAIHEKAHAAASLDDYDLMNECADQLLELYGDDTIRFLFPFMLKLFSQRYEDCREMLDNAEGLDEGTVEMIKLGVYNTMLENMGVGIGLYEKVEVTINEALDILFDYRDKGWLPALFMVFST